MGIGLVKIGENKTSARVAFEIVLASNTSFMVRTNAMLEWMEYGSVRGQSDGVRALPRAEADGLSVKPACLPACSPTSTSRQGATGPIRSGRRGEVLRPGLALSESHRLNATGISGSITRSPTFLEGEAPEPEPRHRFLLEPCLQPWTKWRSGSASMPGVRRPASCYRPAPRMTPPADLTDRSRRYGCMRPR